MSANSHRHKGRQDGAGKTGEDGKADDRGFDRWLNRRLHKIYDPVLHEPVPDEITRLLEGFASKEQDPETPDDER